jgi:hypothetical protein
MAIATVRTVLVAAGAVTALVPAIKITPLVRIQSIAPPAITLTRVSVTPLNHLRGWGSLDANRVQLDAWATRYDACRAIADACRDALEAATFLMELELDSYEPETDPELFHITQDWSVWTT